MRCSCKCRGNNNGLTAIVIFGAVLLFIILPLSQRDENHNGGDKQPQHGQLHSAITEQPPTSINETDQADDADVLIIDEAYLDMVEQEDD